MANEGDDRERWDRRHAEADSLGESGPPATFVAYEHLLPRRGTALDVACGRGGAAVWLAQRGLEVTGYDVSPVAIEIAARRAVEAGVSDRCRLRVHDLDGGLPEGPPVDLVMCHLFRHPMLYRPMIDRLRPGGTLAIAVLSEVDLTSGRFRASRGELGGAFAELEVLETGEGDGRAWLIGRRSCGATAP